MTKPKPDPFAPPPVRWSVGLTCRNEGTQPDGTSRLRTWLQHWTAFIEPDDVVLILHDCDDDSEAIAAEFGVQPATVNVSGLLEVLMWEPVALAPPDTWLLRMGGVDEFVDAAALPRLEAMFREHPDVRLWWLPRRNWCDGVDISDICGYDWQPDLMRPVPPPVKLRGSIHQYPDVLLHGSQVGLVEPPTAAIDHRRTWEEIVKHNRARDGFVGAGMVDYQERFIAQVAERMKREGREVKP